MSQSRPKPANRSSRASRNRPMACPGPVLASGAGALAAVAGDTAAGAGAGAAGAGAGARVTVLARTIGGALTFEVAWLSALLSGLFSWCTAATTVSVSDPAVGTAPATEKSQVADAPGARVVPTTVLAQVGENGAMPGQESVRESTTTGTVEVLVTVARKGTSAPATVPVSSWEKVPDPLASLVLTTVMDSGGLAGGCGAGMADTKNVPVPEPPSGTTTVQGTPSSRAAQATP